MHFVGSDERIRQKEVFSQQASEENTVILAMAHLIGHCIHKHKYIMCDWLYKTQLTTRTQIWI